MKMELRNDGSIHIEGYVNAVERYSKELYSTGGKFIEKVKAEVFTRALDKAENVSMLLNHDVNKKLADTTSGTLELREDAIGLYASAVVSDPNVVADAQAGKLKGWSFGFRALADTWEEGDIQKRTLEDIELLEVSLLTVEPAYIGTSVQYRSEDVETRTVEDSVHVEPADPSTDDTEIRENQYRQLDWTMWLINNK